MNCFAVQRFRCHELRTLHFHTVSENSAIKSNRFEKMADASILVKLINSQWYTFRSLVPVYPNRTRNAGSKGKGYPRTGCEGPEVEYKCRSTLPLTSVLDGVGG